MTEQKETSLTMDRELAHAYMLEVRGVSAPCKRCNGSGVCTYGSTATWRGGIGGQALTDDVCCRCWGSGDENKKWPSHRLLRK